MTMSFLLSPLLLIIVSTISFSINSYPLDSDFNLNNLSPSQIDRLCSFLFHNEAQKPELSRKRFVLPFPDMNRFLSTSQKIHHYHHPHATIKSGTEVDTKKYDFQAYLCSILKDSEEMLSFVSTFIEEHGQAPSTDLFESCEQIAKRDDKSIDRFNELSQVCLLRVNEQDENSNKTSVTMNPTEQSLVAQ